MDVSLNPFFACSGKYDTFRSTFLRENNPDRKDEEKTPCCYGGGIACFLKFKDKLEYVLLYEKFLANPEGELRNLFKVNDNGAVVLLIQTTCQLGSMLA